jgi:hypothetical protein
MPSGQEYANRLREEIRQALAGQVQSFEEELRTMQTQLISSFGPFLQRLGTLGGLEVPATEAVLSAAVADEHCRGVQARSEEMLDLARFTYALRRKETQDEILNTLLDGAHRYAPRLALFVARGHQFSGWASRGYETGMAQKLAACHLASAETPLMARALEADGLTTIDDLASESALARHLPAGLAGPLHAFPLRALGRPVAVLLAAAGDGRSCDLESLCIIMDITGLCIENLALKVLHELKVSKTAMASPPAPRESGGRTLTMVPPSSIPVPEPPQAEPVTVEEVTPAAAASVNDDLPAVEEPTPVPPPAADSAEVVRDEPAVQAEPEPVDTPGEPAEVIPATSTAGVPEEVVAEEAPDQVVVEEETAPTSPELPVEAPPVPPAGPAEPARTAVLREVQPLTEEEKLHADAKRFARLLASEIKLYNEQRVLEGRANRDIYVRLKRDIDRSRDMYEKRVSPLVSRKIDYFHDEIIRVLGDNDPSALGSDYPGPRVES